MRSSSVAIALCAALVANAVVARSQTSVVSDPAAVRPDPRNGFGLAYDAKRSRLVLFGGSDSAFVRRADTWEWDGKNWSQLKIPGPAPRSDFAMTYDSRRGRVVLFGGRTEQGLMHDTWEFDGKTWNLVDTAGPPARQLAPVSFDSDRGRVVLFGGSGAGRTSLDDTWEWDGARWIAEPLSGLVPDARGAHMLVYDAGRKRTVLIAGYASEQLSDLWEWNGKGWSKQQDGPSLFHSAAAYDTDRSQLLVFGGFDGSARTAYLWKRDAAGWKRADADGPSARAEHRGVFVPHVGFVIFGGIGGQGMSLEERGRSKLNDLWAYDGTGWHRLDR
jgi:hypothetical protein